MIKNVYDPDSNRDFAYFMQAKNFKQITESIFLLKYF